MRTLIFSFCISLVSFTVSAASVCFDESYGVGYDYAVFGNSVSYVNDNSLQSIIDHIVYDQNDVYDTYFWDRDSEFNWYIRNRIGYFGGYRYEAKHCFDEDRVLIRGTNRFNLELPNMVGTLSGRAKVVMPDNKEFTLCRYSISPNGTTYHDVNCEASLELDLVEINYDIWQEVEWAMQELDDLVDREITEETNVINEINSVADAFNLIKPKMWGDITESDLLDIESALSLYHGLVRTIAELEQERIDLENDLIEILNQATEQVDSRLAELGYTPNNYSGPLEFTVIEIEPYQSSYQDETDASSYKIQAEQTKNQLIALLQSNQNAKFMLTVRSWLTSTEKIAFRLNNQEIATNEEYAAFVSSVALVNDYLSTVVDSDYWFRDSPVNFSTRESIQTIREYNNSYGKIIEESLINWRNSQLTAEQEELLIAVDAVGKGIKNSENNSSEGNYNEILFGLSSAIVKGAACVSVSVAAGDFGDVYELLFGKDICTGDPLQTWERALSGISLIAGNRHFYQGMLDAVGLTPKARFVLSEASGVKLAAKKVKLTGEELRTLSTKFQRRGICKS